MNSTKSYCPQKILTLSFWASLPLPNPFKLTPKKIRRSLETNLVLNKKKTWNKLHILFVIAANTPPFNCCCTSPKTYISAKTHFTLLPSLHNLTWFTKFGGHMDAFLRWNGWHVQMEATEASREFDDKSEIKRVWVCVTEKNTEASSGGWKCKRGGAERRKAQREDHETTLPQRLCLRIAPAEKSSQIIPNLLAWCCFVLRRQHLTNSVIVIFLGSFCY